MKRNIRVLLIALVVLAIAGGTFAFAAANTVADPGNAGYKASTISGYDITNVVYDLKTGDPTELSKITFNIAPITGSSAPVTVLISTTTSQDFTTSKCVVTHPDDYLATCEFGSMVLTEWTPAAIHVDAVSALDIVVSSSTNP